MPTTNFIDGVTNAAMDSTLYSFIAPDPTVAYTWQDDFMNYLTADWVITAAGTNTIAVENVAGGVLGITTDANDNDGAYFQWAGNTSAAVVETFKFVSGKRAWGKFRAKLSDATQSDFLIGLYVTDTDPITAIVDGVYFRKNDGSTTLSLLQTLNSTSTTTTAGTLANDTWATFGYYYDGAQTMSVFFNETLVANAVTTNLCTDEELAVSFVIQAGEAAVGGKKLSLDYANFWQER